MSEFTTLIQVPTETSLVVPLSDGSTYSITIPASEDAQNSVLMFLFNRVHELEKKLQAIENHQPIL